MAELIPSDVSLPDVQDNDKRIGHLLGNKIDADALPQVVIVGFPSDEGVRRNGGRVGAAKAPAAIRSHLYSMTPDAENRKPFQELLEHTSDVGDLEISGSLEREQEIMGSVLASYLDSGVIPVILGGGHETAYAHFEGYVQADMKTAILNMDAHTDVRPLKDGKAHSGSPFRQVLQHPAKICDTYLAAGLQPYAVASDHLRFIEEHGGQYQFRDETNITSVSSLFHMHESERLMVTFDMDAVDQAHAPGVSAPCVNGLQPDIWLTAAYLAGRNEEVTSFDLSELNPAYDRDGQTARLAALTIWHFLLGLSQR